MRVVDNRGLLLKVRNPNKITTAIPNSKDLGRNNVLVKWGIDESRVLKNLNIKDVPSPIMGKYQWTGKHKPSRLSAFPFLLASLPVASTARLACSLLVKTKSPTVHG